MINKIEIHKLHRKVLLPAYTDDLVIKHRNVEAFENNE